MKPYILQPEDVTVVGRITKPHGYQGSVKIQIEHPGAAEIKTEWVMLMIDQKPVPFFIESIQATGDTWVVKLEDIDTDTKALRYKGIKVALPKDLVPEAERSGAEIVTGYEVRDLTNTRVGIVTDTIDHGYQELILVENESGNTYMVPFVEPIIVEINVEDKLIIIDPPEGLLNIN